MIDSAHRKRIVIVGAGFGGMAAAKGLKGVNAEITLVDRTNHHLFQPLLYQVATAALSPADIAAASRALLRRQRNISVLMAEV
ncbi:MAG TPA: FAD-dependent oxidoreductase, partial [Roseiarcus sp.]|nr:FAD-dependent oxidoreductase [Roseiarcus sp.]